MITLTDKQQQAMKLIEDESLRHIMLYGGSRSGKTFVLCWALHQRAMCYPESRHVILRHRFNHVKQSVWYDTYTKLVRRASPEMWSSIKRNKSDWFWTYPNGSEVWFGGLDDEERVDKILGNEYVTMYLNECSQISAHARDTAITRLAQYVPNCHPKLFYDCNPSSLHHWSYQDFIAQPTAQHACLQMNPQDNLEHLPSHYIGLLEHLPSRQRERFLHGQFQSDIEGALWQQEWIDRNRLLPMAALPSTHRIVIGVDPSVTGSGDETGIIVVAFDGNEAWVLEDATVRATPDAWARRVIQAARFWQADAVVAEVNQGGDLVQQVLHQQDPLMRIIPVRASKGKLTRAEPISALYEQGRVRHRGVFDRLEAQLTHYTGRLSEESPDRLDALVWALTDCFNHVMIPIQEGADQLVLPTTTKDCW